MRYLIVFFMVVVTGCGSKYDECLEYEREQFRQRNPNASHSLMSRKQQEFEMMCSSFKTK